MACSTGKASLITQTFLGITLMMFLLLSVYFGEHTPIPLLRSELTHRWILCPSLQV